MLDAPKLHISIYIDVTLRVFGHYPIYSDKASLFFSVISFPYVGGLFTNRPFFTIPFEQFYHQLFQSFPHQHSHVFCSLKKITVLFVVGSKYFMIHYTHYRLVVLSVVAHTVDTFVSTLGDVINQHVIRYLNLDPLSVLYYTIVISFSVILIIATLTNLAQSA